MFIVESDNFVVVTRDKQEVSRTDGGHITIDPKVMVPDRTYLSPELVIEMALLTNVMGRAMKDGLAERGIKLGRINYQDNGNWNPQCHTHLYGRAFDATYQIYGQPIKAGRTPAEQIPQEPLNKDDIAAIRAKALEYAKTPGYGSLHVR